MLFNEERRKQQWPLIEVGSKVYYSQKSKLEKGELILYRDKLSRRECDYD